MPLVAVAAGPFCSSSETIAASKPGTSSAASRIRSRSSSNSTEVPRSLRNLLRRLSRSARSSACERSRPRSSMRLRMSSTARASRSSRSVGSLRRRRISSATSPRPSSAVAAMIVVIVPLEMSCPPPSPQRTVVRDFSFGYTRAAILWTARFTRPRRRRRPFEGRHARRVSATIADPGRQDMTSAGPFCARRPTTE